MKFRMMLCAGLVLALAGCTTTGTGIARNPVEARWNGQPAGAFFAAYGPPYADIEQGSATVYSWRGGYKTVRIPAGTTPAKDGKKAKQTPARKLYLRCEVKLVVGADYVIRSITTVADRPGVSTPSYCGEFLGAAK